MSFKLFLEAIGKFLLGVVLVGLLVFLPAGSLQFRNGWLFMGILFIPMFIAGIIMMICNPGLLKSRLEAKEKQKQQDLVVKFSGLMFIAGFVIAGLDNRFGWLVLPKGVPMGAAVVFLIAYGLYAEVLRENTYLSRTIQVRQGQTVVDTGLYGIVRHPMYSVTLLLFMAIPLILGSVIALSVFLIYPFLIAQRIRHEEALLVQELPGYEQYLTKVKYRLIPFIW